MKYKINKIVEFGCDDTYEVVLDDCTRHFNSLEAAQFFVKNGRCTSVLVEEGDVDDWVGSRRQLEHSGDVRQAARMRY